MTQRLIATYGILKAFSKCLMALSEAGKILQSLSNAPKAVIRGVVQAGKATFAQAAIFRGCAG
jgi:hypothetical protein